MALKNRINVAMDSRDFVEAGDHTLLRPDEHTSIKGGKKVDEWKIRVRGGRQAEFDLGTIFVEGETLDQPGWRVEGE